MAHIKYLEKNSLSGLPVSEPSLSFSLAASADEGDLSGQDAHSVTSTTGNSCSLVCCPVGVRHEDSEAHAKDYKPNLTRRLGHMERLLSQCTMHRWLHHDDHPQLDQYLYSRQMWRHPSASFTYILNLSILYDPCRCMDTWSMQQ